MRSHCILVRSKPQKTLGKWRKGEGKEETSSFARAWYFSCSQKSNGVLQHQLFLLYRIYLFKTLSKVKALLSFESKAKVKQQSRDRGCKALPVATLARNIPLALFPFPFLHPPHPPDFPNKTVRDIPGLEGFKLGWGGEEYMQPEREKNPFFPMHRAQNCILDLLCSKSTYQQKFKEIISYILLIFHLE